MILLVRLKEENRKRNERTDTIPSMKIALD